MPTEAELRTLYFALRRIVPEADDETVAYVYGRAAIQPDLYRAGAMLLQSHGFDALSPSEMDRVLAALQDHPSVATIVRHAIEGYYTSAAGRAEVGFRVTA